MRPLLVLVWKECLLAWRRPQRWLAETSVGIMLAMIMGMALDVPARIPTGWAAGITWTLLYFTSAVGLHRGDEADSRWNAMWSVWLSPIHRFWIFYAKWISGMLWLIPSATVQLFALWVFLNLGLPAHPGEFALVVALGVCGLSGLSVWVQSLTRGSQAREVLAPFLLFPLGIPLLLGLVRMTEHALSGGGAFPWLWLELACAYVGCGGLLPWLLYDILTEV